MFLLLPPNTDDSLDAVYLLAMTYYRSRRLQQAKHLLSKHRSRDRHATASAKCDLLYARCCLDLNEWVKHLNKWLFVIKDLCYYLSIIYIYAHTFTSHKNGLLALNGLLVLHKPTEDEIAHRFKDDAGIAFWLLGEFNRRVPLMKEAAKHFRSALKYNPLLWSAYEALSEMGRWPLTSYPGHTHQWKIIFLFRGLGMRLGSSMPTGRLVKTQAIVQ